VPEMDGAAFDGTFGGTDSAPDHVRGEGESADGQVRAVAARGRLKELDLASRLMRSPAEELAGHVLTAVNAAFDDLRSKAPSAEAVDPRVLTERLGEVQEQGLRTMSLITQALSDAMEQVRESTGMTGDPSPKGLEQLLEQTRSVADAVRGSTEDIEDLRGEGESADGQVRAVAPPGGRLASLEIDQRAMRMASQELAEHVVAAVNAALEDLQAKSREQAGASRVDPEKLRALRQASTEQMAAYARSLSDLMSSIRQR
jgi:DNA-binding protein YbaB